MRLSARMTRSGAIRGRRAVVRTSGKVPLEKTLVANQYVADVGGWIGWFATHMSKQVFPHAPSPTMTNLRRISAICAARQCESRRVSERGRYLENGEWECGGLGGGWRMEMRGFGERYKEGSVGREG